MEQILKEIEAQMDPSQAVVELLLTHPGVQAVAAMGFVCEVGIDLSRFKSAKHFASWIGVCPGNHSSAGKGKHGKITKGNPSLRALLAEIVWAISHTKDNDLSAQYQRLARRIGKAKAIVAVSHSVAVNFSHMITKRIPYQELGANSFDTEDSPTSQQTHRETFRSPGLRSDLDSKGDERLNGQPLLLGDIRPSCSSKRGEGCFACFSHRPIRSSIFVQAGRLFCITTLCPHFRRK